jgi:[ribosomal protein S5]-alanine N-acetyltransferase
MIPKLSGVRVALAPAGRADRVELVAANRTSRDHHLPWVALFTDEAGFNIWFARSLIGPHVGLVARERASDHVVGVVNLNEIVMGAFQSAYLGYYGMAWCAGRGVMTEAVGLAIGFVFRTIGLHRVEANIQPENIRSIALVQRLGFMREGYSPRYLHIGGAWRDHERWARLAERG